MTREEAKIRAELYSALAEGKTIQVQNPKNGIWTDMAIDCVECFPDGLNYRIKSEPKYRPFKNQEECWQEMLKHQPFGWLKNIRKQEKVHIWRVFEDTDYVLITLSINEGINNSSGYLFNEYTFDDGTPFGIIED